MIRTQLLLLYGVRKCWKGGSAVRTRLHSMISRYMAHRDPNYWTEPEKFNPERFTPENSVGRHPYAFIPFTSGIRGCIGRNYATMLMKVLVTRVVQKYRISSAGSLETLRLKAGVSVRAIDGLKVSITRT